MHPVSKYRCAVRHLLLLGILLLEVWFSADFLRHESVGGEKRKKRMPLSQTLDFSVSYNFLKNQKNILKNGKSTSHPRWGHRVNTKKFTEKNVSSWMDEVLHIDHVCIGELQSMSGMVHVQVRFAKTFRRFVGFFKNKNTHTQPARWIRKRSEIILVIRWATVR